jgi:hypothetical protein
MNESPSCYLIFFRVIAHVILCHSLTRNRQFSTSNDIRKVIEDIAIAGTQIPAAIIVPRHVSRCRYIRGRRCRVGGTSLLAAPIHRIRRIQLRYVCSQLDFAVDAVRTAAHLRCPRPLQLVTVVAAVFGTHCNYTWHK